MTTSTPDLSPISAALDKAKPDPRLPSELQTEAAETKTAMTLLGSFEIHDDESFGFAGNLLKTVKDRWKVLEEKRTSVTGPMNAALRAVNDLFRPVLDPLKQAEAVLKAKIANYTLAQRAAQEAAMQAAAAAIQAGNQAAGMQQVALLAEPARVAGVAVKVKWSFKIVDENLVPREFLTVDERKIQAAIWYADTMTPPRPIPGVEFFQEGQVRVRT